MKDKQSDHGTYNCTGWHRGTVDKSDILCAESLSRLSATPAASPDAGVRPDDGWLVESSQTNVTRKATG